MAGAMTKFDAQILACPPDIMRDAEKLAASEPCLTPEVIAALRRGVAPDARGWLCAPAWRDLGLCRATNDWLRETADASDDLEWLACVSPLRRGARAEVERCADAGAIGVGELDSAAQGWIMGERGETRHVAAACSERGLFAIIKAALPGRGGADARDVIALARAHPALVFAATSLGGGAFLQCADEAVAEDLTNVYWLTGSSPRETVELALSFAPASRRVIHGSREGEIDKNDGVAAREMRERAREMMMA